MDFSSVGGIALEAPLPSVSLDLFSMHDKNCQICAWTHELLMKFGGRPEDFIRKDEAEKMAAETVRSRSQEQAAEHERQLASATQAIEEGKRKLESTRAGKHALREGLQRWADECSPTDAFLEAFARLGDDPAPEDVSEVLHVMVSDMRETARALTRMESFADAHSFEQAQRQHLRSVLHAWRAAYQDEVNARLRRRCAALRERVLSGLVLAAVKRSLAGAFSRWSRFAGLATAHKQQRDGRERALALFESVLTRKSAQNAFAVWKAAARRGTLVRSVLSQTDSRRRKLTLVRAFLSWRAQSRRGREQSHAAACLHAAHESHRRRLCFLRWAHRAKQLKHAAARMIAFRRRLVLSRAVRRWSSSTLSSVAQMLGESQRQLQSETQRRQQAESGLAAQQRTGEEQRAQLAQQKQQLADAAHEAGLQRSQMAGLAERNRALEQETREQQAQLRAHDAERKQRESEAWRGPPDGVDWDKDLDYELRAGAGAGTGPGAVVLIPGAAHTQCNAHLLAARATARQERQRHLDAAARVRQLEAEVFALTRVIERQKGLLGIKTDIDTQAMFLAELNADDSRGSL